MSRKPQKVKLEFSTEVRSTKPFVEVTKAFAYLHDAECRILLINHGEIRDRKVCGGKIEMSYLSKVEMSS